MYAIFEDSGSQYRVSQGDVVRVDLRDLEADQEQVAFEKVLLVHDGELKVGVPYVQSARVLGRILASERDEKVVGVKFKRRKNYRRKLGHRQPFLRVEITEIQS